MRKKIKVILPIHPVEVIDHATQQSIDALKHCEDFEVRVYSIKNINGAFAKNEGINHNRSYKKFQSLYDFTYALIVENGVVFTVDTIKKLCSHDVDIISGIRKTKDNSTDYTAGYFNFTGQGEEEQKEIQHDTKGLIQVDWVNSGLILVKNYTLSNMSYPWFRNELVTYTDAIGEENQFLTDDYRGFCLNAKKNHISIYCDFDCVIEAGDYYKKHITAMTGRIDYTPVVCPICGWEGERFFDVEYDNHVYPNAECPGCLSQPRQRLFAFYWKNEVKIDKKHKLLHISPSPCEEQLLREKNDHIDYLSIDIDPEVGMENQDLTCLTYANESFDIILCFHVLEHIKEDKKAISEIYRVLKKDGTAMIMVPLNRWSDETFEDPTITSPRERMKAYWHWDHLRLYGNDFINRLNEPGFNVVMDNYPASFTKEKRLQYGFDEFDPMFICKKEE